VIYIHTGALASALDPAVASTKLDPVFVLDKTNFPVLTDNAISRVALFQTQRQVRSNVYSYISAKGNIQLNTAELAVDIVIAC